jgi:hypothetical protein
MAATISTTNDERASALRVLAIGIASDLADLDAPDALHALEIARQLIRSDDSVDWTRVSPNVVAMGIAAMSGFFIGFASGVSIH